MNPNSYVNSLMPHSPASLALFPPCASPPARLPIYSKARIPPVCAATGALVRRPACVFGAACVSCERYVCYLPCERYVCYLAAHWFRRFVTSYWHIFDLIIVIVSLLAYGKRAMRLRLCLDAIGSIGRARPALVATSLAPAAWLLLSCRCLSVPVSLSVPPSA